MLCDDDEDDRFFFKDAISDIDNTVTVTTIDDCDKLIDALQQADPPDVLFLDLNMPRKSGKECLSEIREKLQLMNLPIVIYSTSATTQDIDDTFLRGANFYMQKKSNYSVLKQAIKKIITSDKQILLKKGRETYII